MAFNVAATVTLCSDQKKPLVRIWIMLWLVPGPPDRATGIGPGAAARNVDEGHGTSPASSGLR
jgi:hypothetical protein